jgi:tetratricopeptide (TPR) repeat protein
MPDPYLEAMLKGEITTSGGIPGKVAVAKINDRFNVALEKKIEEHLNSPHPEEEIRVAALLTPAVRKAKLKRELLEANKFPELENYLTSAFNILRTKWVQGIDDEMLKEMEERFSKIADILNAAEIETLSTESLYAVLGISDAVMSAMLETAINSFADEEYGNSLSLLVLLTTLAQENPDYWLRLGIAAQKIEDYKLALRAYGITLEIAPNAVGPRLFSVECYLRDDQPEKALEAIEEVKKTLLTSEQDPIWLDLLAKVEAIMAEE